MNKKIDTKFYYSFEIPSASTEETKNLLNKNESYFRNIDDNFRLNYKILVCKENKLISTVYLQIGYFEVTYVIFFLTVVGFLFILHNPIVLILLFTLISTILVYAICKSMKTSLSAHLLYKVEVETKYLFNGTELEFQISKWTKKPHNVNFDE